MIGNNELWAYTEKVTGGGCRFTRDKALLNHTQEYTCTTQHTFFSSSDQTEAYVRKMNYCFVLKLYFTFLLSLIICFSLSKSFPWTLPLILPPLIPLVIIPTVLSLSLFIYLRVCVCVFFFFFFFQFCCSSFIFICLSVSLLRYIEHLTNDLPNGKKYRLMYQQEFYRYSITFFERLTVHLLCSSSGLFRSCSRKRWHRLAPRLYAAKNVPFYNYSIIFFERLSIHLSSFQLFPFPFLFPEEVAQIIAEALYLPHATFYVGPFLFLFHAEMSQPLFFISVLG